nr:MAG: hypothetical protein [Lokiarchaeota virus Fenrir Meg22_1012]URC17263.1 MAG: hypothetical protein [Lokiarchaeota virus Fenrir Meg22_1214]
MIKIKKKYMFHFFMDVIYPAFIDYFREFKSLKIAIKPFVDGLKKMIIKSPCEFIGYRLVQEGKDLYVNCPIKDDICRRCKRMFKRKGLTPDCKLCSLGEKVPCGACDFNLVFERVRDFICKNSIRRLLGCLILARDLEKIGI